MDEDSQMAEDIPLGNETPTSGIFIPPSVSEQAILAGDTYTYFSPIPADLLPTKDDSSSSSSTPTPPTGKPCILGVDEAGRGPVLGPMVYGVFFLPAELSDPLLRGEHHFDDSKVLTPAVRSSLMATLCSSSSSLASSCGWATCALSARDIGGGMLRPASGAGAYNLNAQAMDATVALIRGVMARGANVREIYVDTVGPPATYQKRLERVFPTAKITVAKKADSLYPCVSAASVCAKVTRDAALEVLYRARAARDVDGGTAGVAVGDEEPGWGSGYPSDARCVSWLRRNMHPVFGWGSECRFSWGTARDMLEAKGAGVKVEWPVDEEDENGRLTDFFSSSDRERDADDLGTWFGSPVGLEAF